MSTRFLTIIPDDASMAGDEIGLTNDELFSKIPPKHAREADLVLGVLFNG
jgi:hypothetical protein